MVDEVGIRLDVEICTPNLENPLLRLPLAFAPGAVKFSHGREPTGDC